MLKRGTPLMENPIKRHKALQSLSRDHHHGLLLSWKIRQGFKKGIDAERMTAYARWFWETHLLRHFELEEKQIFPVLGNDNPMVKRALTEHRRITRRFTSNHSNKERTLSLIEEELDNHIRFEEDSGLMLSRKWQQRNRCKSSNRFVPILHTSLNGKMSFGDLE